MKPIKNIVCLAATILTIGSLVDEGNAAVLLRITEDGIGVRFDVTGSINPSSVRRVELWNTAPEQNDWRSVNLFGNDGLRILGDASGRYTITGSSDSGIMATGSVVSEGVLTGTGFTIGTSYFGGSPSLVLSDSLGASTMDFSVEFPGRVLSDFGLVNGDSRLLTFDDGGGGTESITWTVTAIPEPSSAIYLGFGVFCLISKSP